MSNIEFKDIQINQLTAETVFQNNQQYWENIIDLRIEVVGRNLILQLINVSNIIDENIDFLQQRITNFISYGNV